MSQSSFARTRFHDNLKRYSFMSHLEMIPSRIPGINDKYAEKKALNTNSKLQALQEKTEEDRHIIEIQKKNALLISRGDRLR
jgi:hypothetical protein